MFNIPCKLGVVSNKPGLVSSGWRFVDGMIFIKNIHKFLVSWNIALLDQTLQEFFPSELAIDLYVFGPFV